MIMEFRVYVQISRIPLEDAALWEPLIGWLERNHGDLGPVISWEDSRSARITVAVNAEDAAVAAETASSVVARALHANELGTRYPHTLEVEPAETELRATA